MSWWGRAGSLCGGILAGMGEAIKVLCFGFLVGVGFTAAAILVVALCVKYAMADTIPREAQQYRSTIIRCFRAELGLDAPTAVGAAQVAQESGWNKRARSGVGARGLAQFMPATERWLGEIRPDLGPPDAWNPGWALRAMAAYDAWLLKRVKGRDKCQKWAAATASYNMGLGWWFKAAALAERLGLEPDVWFESTETVNPGQSDAAFCESRNYSKIILLKLTPLYERAGWGRGVCS